MDFLTNKENWLLALYLKRMTFEDALRRSDTGTPEQEKAMAYEILSVVEKVQKRLADEGFSPR